MKFKFSTRLTPVQATRHLEAFFKSRQRFVGDSNKAYEVVGKIKGHSFRFLIRDKKGKRSAFRPILCGKILESSQGSTINCRFVLDKIEKIILSVWLTPLIILSFYFIFSTIQRIKSGTITTREYYIAAVPILMVVLTIIWVVCTRFIFKDQTKLKNFIFSAFKDSIVNDK